jgi:hypothetical protein
MKVRMLKANFSQEVAEPAGAGPYKPCSCGFCWKHCTYCVYDLHFF